MADKPLKVLVAAGGTGGHLFPAMAVVEQLEDLTQNSCRAEFVGTHGRIEAEAVPKAGYEFHAIPISGLGPILSLNTLRLPFKIYRSIAMCKQIISRFRPDVVLCTGAYLSYPAGMAASALSVPLYLLESNASPGKTIKMLASRATRLFVSFKETLQYFKHDIRDKISVVGNPIRKSFVPLPECSESRKFFGLQPDTSTVLCFGGSLGARSINLAFETALPLLLEKGYQVIWQTGKHYKPTNIPSMSSSLKILPFIDNMPAAYSAANLILCRSGATTVAELTAVGKPAILVPLPHASNDEQTQNARIMADAGAARILEDSLLPDSLPTALLGLMQAPEKLGRMAENSLALGKPEAAKIIAESIIHNSR